MLQFLVVVLLAAAAGVNSFDTAADDVLWLQQLYLSTNGPNWRSACQTNWVLTPGAIACNQPLSTATNGYWTNWGAFTQIVCRGDRVIKLSFYNCTLAGMLPPMLNGAMSQLMDARFGYGNALSGSPDAFAALQNLTYLDISQNQFSGTISPGFGNLSMLTTLNMGFNQLNGTIPATLGSLALLQYLSLRFNQLTGTIPPVLGGSGGLMGPAMLTLYLDSNALSGTMPSLRGLPLLQYLNVSNNSLSGPLPANLPSSFKAFDISSNQMTGTIPASIGDWKNVTSFSIRNNQITGTIPPELGNLSQVANLYLDHNQLSGTLPASLSNCVRLAYGYFSDNQLTGGFPHQWVPSPYVMLLGLRLEGNCLDYGGIPSSDVAWWLSKTGGGVRITYQRWNCSVVQCSGPGRYLPPNATCAECSAGCYCPGGNMKYPCGAGLYNPLTGQSSPTQCLSCPIGTYNPLTGQWSNASCASCPAGSYASTPGSTDCTKCPVGTYSNAVGGTSSASCMPCPAGTYNSGTGASSCTPCQAGTFNEATGSSSVAACTMCPAGTSNPLTAQPSATACVACSAGTYSQLPGAAACSLCPVGTNSSGLRQISAAACVPCPPGQYNDQPGMGLCTSCSPGTYNPNNGSISATACLACPAGSFNPNAGSTTCALCPSGSFNAQIRQSDVGACLYCSPGSFSSVNGSSRCTLCPISTFTSATGATTCAYCKSSTTLGSASCSETVVCSPPTAPANASVSVTSRSSSTATAVTRPLVTSGVDSLAVTALFGIPMVITASLTPFPSSTTCAAVLAVFNDDASSNTSSSSTSPLPAWMSVSSTSTSLTITGTVTSKDAAAGTVAVVFRMVAWDAVWNPYIRITITVESSLSLSIGPPSLLSPNASDHMNLQLSTPATLISLSIAMDATALQVFDMLCPVSVLGAFCAVDAASGTLGAFGTAGGIRNVLNGVRVVHTKAAVASSASTNVSGALLFHVSEDVNPDTVSLSLPVSSVPQYPGIVNLQPLPNATAPLMAMVGVAVTLELSDYFSAGTTISYRLAAVGSTSAYTSWLSIVGSVLQGTPPQLSNNRNVTTVSLVASEMYVSIWANVTISVSNPAPPAVVVTLTPFQVATSDQVTFLIPSSTFVDPQGFPLTVSMYLSDDGRLATRLPLPSFLRFDPASWSLSTAPQATDVGTYTVVVVASSSSGTFWTGETATSTTVVVRLSALDFLSLVYGWVGIVGSILSVLAFAFAKRAFLRNLVLFSRAVLATAPAGFCSGEPTLLRGADGNPIAADTVKSIRVYELTASPRDVHNRPWWYPAYLEALFLRVERTFHQNPAAEHLGVDWVTSTVHENTHAAVSVALHRPQDGGLSLNEKMYALEVRRSGFLWEDVVLLYFTFRTGPATVPVYPMISEVKGIGEEHKKWELLERSPNDQATDGHVHQLQQELAALRGEMTVMRDAHRRALEELRFEMVRLSAEVRHSQLQLDIPPMSSASTANRKQDDAVHHDNVPAFPLEL